MGPFVKTNYQEAYLKEISKPRHRILVGLQSCCLLVAARGMTCGRTGTWRAQHLHGPACPCVVASMLSVALKLTECVQQIDCAILVLCS
mmetsp:Transcript_28794/g.72321  ORF Transcript_28794/g.72321 Transcript_28794/m.72321 type:complete len:89 (+) Transcript_28794:1027-1293(+)